MLEEEEEEFSLQRHIANEEAQSTKYNISIGEGCFPISERSSQIGDAGAA